MSKANKALECFNSGYNCSQAVFSTYCSQLGMEEVPALKLSCAFGGGMGRLAGTCGAVTGAYMLIGLQHGKYLQEDEVSKELTYGLVQEFTKRFEALYGTTSCKDLLNCDISTPEGEKQAKEQGLWKNLCPKFIKDACIIIENMLEL
ncbi:MAG: C-GCAxxG-C-C family protein [Termitinemataceae bacterium]